MNEAQVTMSLQDLALGPIRFYPQLGSTNDLAAEWAAQGAPHLALVMADEQTAGRGRLQRRWFTPPASALAFSLVLREFPWEQGMIASTPLPYPETMLRLTGLGALAVCQSLEHYDLRPEIKWPNDVLLLNRKVSGILCEASWQGSRLDSVILGIGVNVTPASVPPDDRVLFPAISVQDALQRPVERLELLHNLLASLLEWLPILNEPDFLQAWNQRLAYRGQEVGVYHSLEESVPLPAVPDQAGTLLGLASHGALQLRLSNGQVETLHNGELRLRPLSSSSSAQESDHAG